MKLLTLFFTLALLSAKSQTWERISDFPSTERDDGAVFVIGSKAYCGSGYLPWYVVCGDFHCFDMRTDSWSTVASLPAGNERQYVTGFSNDTFGFIFGGITGSTYLNDLWRYNPALNSWTAMTPMPASARRGAACFVIDSVAYIIGGTTASNVAINEVWAYDMIHDSWQSKNNLPFGSRAKASAVSQNNKGYLIFGRDENNRFCPELYEYNPITDSWNQISSFPDAGRSYSTLSSFKGDLIIVAGVDTSGTHYDDMWRYIPSSSTWQQLQSIPASGRKGGLCFNDSAAIYYTTGITQSFTRLKETWKCANPTALIENSKAVGFIIYPNPAGDYITVEMKNNIPSGNSFYTVFDYLGNVVSEETAAGKMTQINLAGLSKGLYFLRYRSESSSITMKAIKN